MPTCAGDLCIKSCTNKRSPFLHCKTFICAGAYAPAAGRQSFSCISRQSALCASSFSTNSPNPASVSYEIRESSRMSASLFIHFWLALSQRKRSTPASVGLPRSPSAQSATSAHTSARTSFWTFQSFFPVFRTTDGGVAVVDVVEQAAVMMMLYIFYLSCALGAIVFFKKS